MSKKDIKVELLRVIACFMVLVYHTRRLPILEDGSVSETAIFIECMCTICVVTFFLISGFFIYKKSNDILVDWRNIFLSYLKTLCVAGLLMAIVCIVFKEYILSQKNIYECIKTVDIKATFILVIDGIKSLSVNLWPGTCAHLWYVFSYGLIILWYPITRLFLKLDKRIIYTVLIILALLQLYDDILVYYDKWTFNIFFDYVPRPVIYSAWGHMLYNDILCNIRNVNHKLSTTKTSKAKCVGNTLYNKNVGDALYASRSKSIGNIFISKKILAVSVIMYMISFAGIFYMQYMYNTYVRGIHTYTAWYSIGSLTLSMAVVMFVMNVNVDKIFNDNIKKVVYMLGGMTLGIYMLHYPIVVKLNTMLFQKMIQDTLGLNFVTQMIYVLFYNAMIFILSVAFLWLVRLVGTKFRVMRGVIKKLYS